MPGLSIVLARGDPGQPVVRAISFMVKVYA